MQDGASESGSNVEPELDGSAASGTDSDSEDELAFDSPAPSSSTAALPISALYSSHPDLAAPPRKAASLPRRRFTDAGLTPDASTSVETLHACGHSHALGGPALPWQPGASHHHHAHAHASHAHSKPRLWGLPGAARPTLPACWGPTSSAGLRLPPLLAPGEGKECQGPPVALRPRSLSPGGTTTSEGRLHLLAQLSSDGTPRSG